MRRRIFNGPLAGALAALLAVPAFAQDGHHGDGHDTWHRDFYAKLKRNDGEGPCCNNTDCRPTQSRAAGSHYEVKVDNQWVVVPDSAINAEIAPDGGAHVCAPKQMGHNRGVLYCVILPPGG
jgi:hypothetical protein